MNRIPINDTTKYIGKQTEVSGWVFSRRDHGKIIFIDLKDRSGIIQTVFTPQNKEIYRLAETLRANWLVSITGEITKRPEKMSNPNTETGTIELNPQTLVVLNKSETPPFALDTDGYEIGEETRLKYRYLDLKRERLQKNITIRHKINQFARQFLSEKDFIEIETPILTKSTPEGARDYIVPSRLQKGNFYALPQSPQQYKQLLMVAGFEKYFQIAKCFRDEDTRGDRQPEFAQLDLEMSFAEEKDIMNLIESLLIELVKNIMPGKKITKIPFPIIKYEESISKYGSDQPDLRKNKNDKNELAFCWIIDFPFFEKTEEDKLTYGHNPFTSPKQEFKNNLLKNENLEDIIARQYDIVLNGCEIGGGGIRSYEPEILEKVFEILGHSKKSIKEKFGHMIEAFKYGAPPHGGIALGLDRLIMLLLNEPNIRETIAFPKTGDGRDLMMNSPSEIETKQLKELGIKFKKN